MPTLFAFYKIFTICYSKFRWWYTFFNDTLSIKTIFLPASLLGL